MFTCASGRAARRQMSGSKGKTGFPASAARRTLADTLATRATRAWPIIVLAIVLEVTGKERFWCEVSPSRGWGRHGSNAWAQRA